jgi:hypothetical protein
MSGEVINSTSWCLCHHYTKITLYSPVVPELLYSGTFTRCPKLSVFCELFNGITETPGKNNNNTSFIVLILLSPFAGQTDSELQAAIFIDYKA